MADLARQSQPGHHGSDLRASELDDLLRQSALGDATAFGTLYDRTVVRFFGLALAVLGDHGHAEETTRTAYAQIWARSRQFDGAQHGSLSWMTTIVYELARTARTARHRVRPVRPCAPGQGVTAGTSSSRSRVRTRALISSRMGRTASTP